MQEYCQNDPGKMVVYFYFSFNDNEKKDVILMLKSIIYQLLLESIKIPKYFDTLFSSSAYKIGQRSLSKNDTLNLLKHTVQEFPYVYLIIDALDESTQIKELMNILEKIADWQLQNLKMIVTSRKERDVEESLKKFVDMHNIICLKQDLVDEDISRFVQHALDNNTNLSKWRNCPNIHKEIKLNLMKGARGMFRWAACQLNELAKCRNLKKLRDSLATLPPTLDETYDRILANITEEDSEYALRILRWLSFSIQPPSLDELAEIVAIDVDEEPTFKPEEVLIDSQEVLNICSSLVTITTGKYDEKPKVIMAHYSVKEYLVSERSRQGRAARFSMYGVDCNNVLAGGCLGYLLQFQNFNIQRSEVVENFKLATTAARDWMKYCQKAEEESESWSHLAFTLFSGISPTYLIWIQLYDEFEYDRMSGLDGNPDPIYYAAELGIRKLIIHLLERKADVNTLGGFWGSPLCAASSRGHKEIVELLLDSGAEIDLQEDKISKTTLGAAIFARNKEVVELLLIRGAKINLLDGQDNTILYEASFYSNKEIVQLLLDRGAKIDLQGGKYNTSLQVASFHGNKEIVDLLLDRGAEIDQQGGQFNTALQAASRNGDTEVIELLLIRGAEINLQGGEYDTALKVASCCGNKEAVELLLDRGAEINLQGGWYDTALQQASASDGNVELVRLLLDRGARTDLYGGENGSPLYIASQTGGKKIAGLLLAYGTDVNSPGGKFQTALHIASSKGYEQIVELLIAHGADINSEADIEVDKFVEKKVTPLEIAYRGGSKAVVQLLRDRGAVSGSNRWNHLELYESEPEEPGEFAFQREFDFYRDTIGDREWMSILETNVAYTV